MPGVQWIQPALAYGVPSHMPHHSFGDMSSVNAARRFAQGAGSALLVFAGADSITDGAADAAAGSPPIVDMASIDGIAQSVFQGGLTGPVQIAAAVLLYLVAGRSISRLMGFVIAIVAVALYLQGVTMADAAQFMDQLSRRAAAAIAAFQAA